MVRSRRRVGDGCHSNALDELSLASALPDEASQGIFSEEFASVDSSPRADVLKVRPRVTVRGKQSGVGTFSSAAEAAAKVKEVEGHQRGAHCAPTPR